MPGDQLPTVRQLAVELRVNANTVARVYGELERDRRARNAARRRLVRRRDAGASAAAAPSTRSGCAPSSTRVLADAAAAGFTRDEVVTELRRRT